MSYPSKAGGLSACQSCTGRASPNGGWVGRASTGRYATVTTPCRKPNGERRPFNLSWEKSVTNKNLKSGRVLPRPLRSEEHTSELQSLMRISYAVFCLKKKTTHKHSTEDISSHQTI